MIHFEAYTLIPFMIGLQVLRARARTTRPPSVSTLTWSMAPICGMGLIYRRSIPCASTTSPNYGCEVWFALGYRYLSVPGVGPNNSGSVIQKNEVIKKNEVRQTIEDQTKRVMLVMSVTKPPFCARLVFQGTRSHACLRKMAATHARVRWINAGRHRAQTRETANI